ncbi:UNVERIFIED_CONTAM: hypothetical protein PYX00_004109 [Menopon gallinae]|uniref:Malonyl-CoA decarboxylase C-terminal domain-containing protein n=1 Tax=Menopon gallinae TaxID=328185 RepID=A0AAW2I2W9_9NEOP
MWFSVGFLELERITWKSPCEMLQKISEYEAVHPVRNWTDLKRRVGPYRRCFIFKHSSMPGEPLVVLHTALAGEISSSMNQIVLSQSKMSGYQSGEKGSFQDAEENPQDIKAAVFYSISSTQKGLQGIELGNYLIKRVVGELQNEFPHMKLFSSLSPIPLFRQWLFERLKIAKRGYNDIFSEEEIRKFQTHFKTSDIYDDLRRSIFTNSWLEDKTLADLLETPLMRLCARYLYLEKRRGYALDSVANFHLKNGAVMWRLNWNANLQPRGLTNSCGIMVNYRYFLEETEMRSTAYVEKQEISASEQIIKYSEEAKHLIRFVNSSKL